jgi:hypothetical protein
MTRITFSQLIAGALFSLCLATVPARALSDRTYVSGKGADTGACTTPATACRTFAYAIGQTATSGTIIVIDPANYGPVTINNSLSIVADGGGPAGIFINTGTAITINPGKNIIVNLRGLTLDGAGTASTGVAAVAPSNLTPETTSVTITDCFIRHFSSAGIAVAGVRYKISNTVSADNTGGVGLVAGFGGFIDSSGVLDHFTASGNNIGLSLTVATGSETNTATIVNSVIVDNATDGLAIGGPGKEFGIAYLAGSVVTGNGTGVTIGAFGTVYTYGDNEINNNNVTDVVGKLTLLAKK